MVRGNIKVVSNASGIVAKSVYLVTILSNDNILDEFRDGNRGLLATSEFRSLNLPAYCLKTYRLKFYKAILFFP
jgi:hypothetical protein